MVGPAAPIGSVRDHVRNMGDPWRKRPQPLRKDRERERERDREPLSAEFVHSSDDATSDDDDEDDGETAAEFAKRINSSAHSQNASQPKRAAPEPKKKLTAKKSGRYTNSPIPVMASTRRETTESS